MKQLIKFDNMWLKAYLENSVFDADAICKKIDMEHEYSKTLLEMIVLEADKNMITKSVASELTLETLRHVYNHVNGLSFEEGLKVEEEFRKSGFKE